MKDMDGFISRAELRMIFSALPERLTEEEIEEMLDAADEDGKREQWQCQRGCCKTNKKIIRKRAASFLQKKYRGFLY